MTMDRDHHELAGDRLGEADARALDALAAAGFDPDAVDPRMRPEAARIAGLLGMLDRDGWRRDGSSADLLADRVMTSVHEALRDGYERETALSTADGEALEAAVMAGFETARVPGALRERARRHGMLADSVVRLGDEHERWIAAGRAVRTEAVMRAVTSADAATIPFEQPRTRSRFRFMDLVAAAAMVLLATAVSMPVMNSMSADGHRRVCVSNLQAAGLGIGMYAMSNDDALPMATAGFGGSWSQVGVPGRSHSANLYTLVRTKHVMPWDLECPGNEHAPGIVPDDDAEDWGSADEVSYSYRLMPRGRNSLSILGAGAVVLSDRNPLVQAGLRGIKLSPETSSMNHGMEGQNLLRVDESVTWTTTPLLDNNDNIWLPRSVEQFVHTVRKKYGYVGGTELPTAPDDTFMGP